MSFHNLLALIDDIAASLDDVATMTKVAAQKTSGVLGDDLALNAEQVIGSPSEREIPIILAVAKGSLKNKAILVPLALVISFVSPWLILPLLMVGGLFLCFEGAEKIVEKFFINGSDHSDILGREVTEEFKIKGAIRTDFILSAEIIVISLESVSKSSFLNQILALTLISILMTVGVYGLVAAIVKLDDLGLFLSKTKSPLNKFGKTLIFICPYFMKLIGIVGTAAMFLVGGDIIIHTLEGFNLFKLHFDSAWGIVIPPFIGIISGLICLGAFKLIPKQFIRTHFKRSN